MDRCRAVAGSELACRRDDRSADKVLPEMVLSRSRASMSLASRLFSIVSISSLIRMMKAPTLSRSVRSFGYRWINATFVAATLVAATLERSNEPCPVLKRKVWRDVRRIFIASVLSQALHQYVGHRLDLIFMPFRASHPIRIIHSLIRIADICLPSEAGNSLICMKKSANSSLSKVPVPAHLAPIVARSVGARDNAAQSVRGRSVAVCHCCCSRRCWACARGDESW
jgi:hypothetical protein